MFFSTVFAAPPADPIGIIQPSIGILTTPAITPTGELPGIISFFNTLLRVVFVIGGLYAFFNIVLAGIGFMSGGGDPKAVAKSWERIWQSLVGLLIIVASFLLAAIIGIVVFKDPSAILVPKITR